jgi:hypothetical protein
MKRRGKTTSGFRQVILPRVLPGTARPHVLWVQPADYERSLFSDMAG